MITKEQKDFLDLILHEEIKCYGGYVIDDDDMKDKQGRESIKQRQMVMDLALRLGVWKHDELEDRRTK